METKIFKSWPWKAETATLGNQFGVPVVIIESVQNKKVNKKLE